MSEIIHGLVVITGCLVWAAIACAVLVWAVFCLPTMLRESFDAACYRHARKLRLLAQPADPKESDCG